LSGPAGEIIIPTNPTSWISENQWPDFYRQFYGAGQIDVMKGIDEHLMKYPEQWKVLFDNPQPQEIDLPEPFNSSLNKFQKIIVIKSIRPDKVIPSIQNYVSMTMG
jgi:dynein heavy chain